MFDKHFHPGNLSKGIKDPAKAELAAECPFCLFPDSASHWSVQCSSIPRSVELRKETLIHIRGLIKTTVDENAETDAKIALRHLGDDY